MRRRPRAVGVAFGTALAVVVLGLLPLRSAPPAAGAQAPPSTSTSTSAVEPVPVPPIIPLPNSGKAPESATDPGGWGQYAVFAGILAGLGVIGLLVWRESRQRSGRPGQHP